MSDPDVRFHVYQPDLRQFWCEDRHDDLGCPYWDDYASAFMLCFDTRAQAERVAPRDARVVASVDGVLYDDWVGTHSPTCYREHHGCAVARLDRLKRVLAAVDIPLEQIAVDWADVDPENDLCAYCGECMVSIIDLDPSPLCDGCAQHVAEVGARALVAVRDITEGRS